MARVISHGNINLKRGVGKVTGVDAILGIDRCGDGSGLVKIVEIDARGIGDDGHAGKIRVVRRSLSRLLLGGSAPQRAFGGAASGNSLLVGSHGFVNVRSADRGVRIRGGGAIGIAGSRIGNERHEGSRAARRGGLGARHGARGGSDVIAVVRAGLATVSELIDCDLIDVARARGIAADRRVVVEHAIDHGPGLGLVHGVCGASDGGNAIIGMTTLEGTGQARKESRGRLLGLGLGGRRRSIRLRILLLRGNRGRLELAAILVDVSGPADGIGLEQALFALGTVLGNAQRGGVDAHTRHSAHGKGNGTCNHRLVHRRKRQRRGIHHHGGGKADPARKSGKDCSLCCIRRSHELSPSSSTQIASFSWLRERR